MAAVGIYNSSGQLKGVEDSSVGQSRLPTSKEKITNTPVEIKPRLLRGRVVSNITTPTTAVTTQQTQQSTQTKSTPASDPKIYGYFQAPKGSGYQSGTYDSSGRFFPDLGAGDKMTVPGYTRGYLDTSQTGNISLIRNEDVGYARSSKGGGVIVVKPQFDDTGVSTKDINNANGLSINDNSLYNRAGSWLGITGTTNLVSNQAASQQKEGFGTTKDFLAGVASPFVSLGVGAYKVGKSEIVSPLFTGWSKIFKGTKIVDVIHERDKGNRARRLELINDKDVQTFGGATFLTIGGLSTITYVGSSIIIGGGAILKTVKVAKSPTAYGIGEVASYAVPFAAIKGFGKARNVLTERAFNKLNEKPFLINYEKSGGELLKYNTAYGGYYKSYDIVATRQTKVGKQTLMIDLKSIPTGEKKAGFGLSYGRIDTQIKGGILRNPVDSNVKFDITGGSNVVQSAPIVFNMGNKVSFSNDIVASAGISKGFIFTKDTSRPFYGIGAAQSNKLGNIDIFGGGNKLKYGVTIGDETSTNSVIVPGKFDSSVLQIFYNYKLKSNLGIKGTIRGYNPTTPKDIDFVGGTNREKLIPNKQIPFENGLVLEQKNIMPKTEIGSALSGISKSASQLVQLETPKYSTGSYAGLGTYERTEAISGFGFSQKLTLQQPVNINKKSNSIFSFSSPQAITPVIQTPVPIITSSQFTQSGTNQITKYTPNTYSGQSYKITPLLDIPLVPGVPFSPPPNNPFIIPTLDLDLSGNLSPRRSGKQKKKRVPSLYAAMFNIKAPSASASEITGITLRPILTSRRRKR